MIELRPFANTIVSIFLFVLVLTMVGTGTVAADSHDEWEEPEGGIICGDSAGAETAQNILRSVIAIFMIFGLVFGIMLYAASKFEETLADGVLGGLDGMDSFFSAVKLMFLVFFVGLIAEPLFGIRVSCIIPNFF